MRLESRRGQQGLSEAGRGGLCPIITYLVDPQDAASQDSATAAIPMHHGQNCMKPLPR